MSSEPPAPEPNPEGGRGRARRDFKVGQADFEAMRSLLGLSAEQMEEQLGQAQRQMEADWEQLKRERPEVVTVSDRERRHLEDTAARRGTTFEQVLMEKALLASRISAGFQQMRKKGRKLKKSDFAELGDVPPGLDEIPPDLLEDDLKNG